MMENARLKKDNEILQELVNQQIEEIDWQFKENDRLRQINNDLVHLCLSNGIISRGKACEILKIDRADLDGWIMEYEKAWKGEGDGKPKIQPRPDA